MQTFKTKKDVDNTLKSADLSKGIPKACHGIVQIVGNESPELFDKICEMIESAQITVSRRGGQFLATMYGKGFSQISYDSSRVPKNYAFVCILKQILPE